MPTLKTSQAQKCLQFDSLSGLEFSNLASVGNNVALSTVQAIIALPFDCKIYHVAVAYAGTMTGTVQLQVVTGTGSGASAKVGTVDTVAPANTILFATAPTITAAAGITQCFYPDVFDVVYQGANASLGVAPSCLSLRFITSNGGSDGLSGITSVVLGVKPVNMHAAATYDTTPAGNYSFDCSVF